MEILKINPKNFKKTVTFAVRCVKAGKVIIGPSDTVYGIYCDGRNERAIRKIMRMKKRSSKKAMPIFVSDIKTAKKFAKISKSQELIVKKKWPGSFTFVFESKRNLPAVLTPGKKTIGIRIPKSKLLLSVLEIIKTPLAQTSANISDKPAATEIKKVIHYFQNQKCRPDFVIDAGNLKKNRPSKVIDLTAKKPKILRR